MQGQAGSAARAAGPPSPTLHPTSFRCRFDRPGDPPALDEDIARRRMEFRRRGSDDRIRKPQWRAAMRILSPLLPDVRIIQCGSFREWEDAIGETVAPGGETVLKCRPFIQQGFCDAEGDFGDRHRRQRELRIVSGPPPACGVCARRPEAEKIPQSQDARSGDPPHPRWRRLQQAYLHASPSGGEGNIGALHRRQVRRFRSETRCNLFPCCREAEKI